MSRYADLMELAETFLNAALDSEAHARYCRKAHDDYVRQALEIKEDQR